MDKPLLGISSCLMGHTVRYDGQHKRDSFLVDTLGKFVDYVPVCPEVESGMPIPRPAMRLVGSIEDPRLLTRDGGQDLTGQMQGWISCKLPELADLPLCGFIFKAKSPSSGMERVKVYNGRGGLSGRASGMFAKAFMERFPLVPAEDEGRLNDADIRENFIERVFTVWRFRQSVSSKRDLVKFQEQNKLLFMSHSPQLTRELGRVVATPRGGLKAIQGKYEDLLAKCLKLQATPAKHTNALHHAMGYLKKLLSADEKAELLEIIDEYRAGDLPLIVPITLLTHYVRKYQVAYLLNQYYLQPHPLELKLRNHA
jgi:uncharacterized protein YbgA (DUF1722 family)/uncharacterized protein YbbK (DUF523 family)